VPSPIIRRAFGEFKRSVALCLVFARRCALDAELILSTTETIEKSFLQFYLLDLFVIFVVESLCTLSVAPFIFDVQYVIVM